MSDLVKTNDYEVVQKELQKRGFDQNKIAREISFACQIINGNPKLQDTTIKSRLGAVISIANIGLTLNPVAKEAYLIPRWKQEGSECVVEPSYIGFIKLLTDSGSITSIICNPVYENDKIEISLSDNITPVIHKPELIQSKRGELIGCYAVATLHNGNRQAEWIDVQGLNDIRERSETYKAHKAGKVKTCTWVSDYVEMCRKTVVRRIYKYLPRTEQMERVDEAVKIQNGDFEPSEEQKEYCLILAEKCHYTDDEVKQLQIDMLDMDSDDISKKIEQLKSLSNEINSDVHNVPNPSQKQINNHIKKLSE